jgi:pyrrolidone-carboxylate peptidase
VATAPVVLVTGFDPFDGASRNPSGEIVLDPNGAVIAGARGHGLVAPTAFGDSVRAALNADPIIPSSH